MSFREDLLTPIARDNPSGPNLRYDPVRDKIKDARREDVEAPQGAWKTEIKSANWGVVIDLASETLAKRSKDLQVAVWLVDAHVRREGLAALTPAFDFLNGFVDTFWETLHPEIEDGDLEERSSILTWLGSKLEGPLRVSPLLKSGLSWASYRESLLVGTEREATSKELRDKREQLIGEGKVSGEQWAEALNATPKSHCEALQRGVEASLQALEKLTATCDGRFGADAPSFSPTQSILQEIAALLRGFINDKGGPTATAAAPVTASPAPAVTVKAPEAPVTVPPAPVSAASPPHPVAAPVVSGSSEPENVADAERRLVAICRFLRESDKYDIAPFLILRGLRFGQLRYNGPDKIDENMLEEPPSGMRAELKRLYTEQNWDGLLDATERAMSLPCGRGWLDVQFYAVKALEGKGEWWAFVAEAVRTELRGLLSDMPKLLDLSLTDSTPVASADTRKWIESEVLGGAAPRPKVEAATPVRAEPPASDETPQLDNAELDEKGDAIFQQALAEGQVGRLTDAVQLLARQLASEASGRKRFLRRVQIAHVLVAGGQGRVALPFLEELASEIEKRSLDTWEDATALAYPLSLMLQCLNGNGESEADREKIYARLCRLDPARALAMEQ